jgi:hypothetical protein
MRLHRVACAALLAVLLVVVLTHTRDGSARAQTEYTADTYSIPISPSREDVKAIGMGKTQIANGRTFNAMLYNPALLARTRTSFDVIGVQASLPGSTFDALTFLSNNRSQFSSGQFLKDIRAGYNAYQNAVDLAGQIAAIRKINAGLKFINDFQSNVLGSAENPKTQGIMVVPNVQVQLGNWGFSVHANLQSGFQCFPGQAVTELLALKIPENVDNITPEELLRLAAIVLPLFDANGNLSYRQAIPTTFAVAYLDIVGAAGYAYTINEGLSVGANLKVINRRFSTKIINSDNYDKIVSEVRSEFQSSITGVTVDLGGVYRYRKTGTDIGLTLQNIIPVPKATSTATLTGIAYDAGGNPQPVNIRVPFELTVPVLLNLGVTQPITPQWDASFDWVDIVAQDTKHETYVERFRLGTEYRLEAIPRSLGIAVRVGVADKRFAGGLGLNLFRAVQVDGAYAYDTFIGDYSYFAQLKIGW